MSSPEIVFRRKVRMLWLEQGLALAASGADWESARAALEPEVAAENAGMETIRKVLEHIKRVWFDPPPEAVALLQDALVLSRRPGVSTKALCWGWLSLLILSLVRWLRISAGLFVSKARPPGRRPAKNARAIWRS